MILSRVGARENNNHSLSHRWERIHTVHVTVSEQVRSGSLLLGRCNAINVLNVPVVLVRSLAS
jgi:hypothetical protein